MLLVKKYSIELLTSIINDSLLVNTFFCKIFVKINFLLTRLHGQHYVVNIHLGVDYVFQERLKALRQKKDIMQKDVALALNISRQVYNNYELGKREPDIEMVGRLADFYGCSADYLLGKSDVPTYTPLDIPESMQDVKAGFHRSEFEELTQDEVEALALIADKLKAARMANKGK